MGSQDGNIIYEGGECIDVSKKTLGRVIDATFRPFRDARCAASRHSQRSLPETFVTHRRESPVNGVKISTGSVVKSFPSRYLGSENEYERWIN